MELLDKPPFPEALDNTKIDAFLVCERKFWWEHIQGIVLKTPSIHLHFGDAFHQALEVWYQTGSQAMAKEKFASVMEGADFHASKNLEHGLAIIEEYITHYKKEAWSPLLQEEGHKTELTFALPIADEMLYVGKIDMVMKWDDRVMFVDHKTTSQLGASYFNGIKPNRQFAGYQWALEHYYDVYGGLINAIFIGKPKTLTIAQQKDIEHTRAEIGDVAAAMQQRMLTVNTRFGREIAVFSQNDIKEWHDDTLKVLGMMRETHEKNNWIKNTHSCNYYGLCPYHNLCIEPRSFMEVQPHDALYTRRFWNPLEHGKDETE